MTETTEVQADPVTKVARDLAEIIDLYARLLARAVDEGGHPSMPGGAAMVALGNVANIESWENHQQATERYSEHPDERLRRVYTSVADEDPDEAWSAYQLIEFWSEAWRAERGAEYDMRHDIGTEANFVRSCLDWAWDNEPAWDDFAADIRQARLRMEDIVHAGRRQERTRIQCDRCEDPPRLLHLMGSADDGSQDRWKCPRCRHRFDADGVHRAHARMLHSDDAKRWVPQADAISTLKAQGRSEHTVRKWLVAGHGEGFCDPITRQVYVYWPSLWRRHLTAKTRNRAAT